MIAVHTCFRSQREEAVDLLDDFWIIIVVKHVFGFLAAAADRDRKSCSALVAAVLVAAAVRRLADRVVVVGPSRRGCSGLLVEYGLGFGWFGFGCAGGA